MEENLEMGGMHKLFKLSYRCLTFQRREFPLLKEVNANRF